MEKEECSRWRERQEPKRQERPGQFQKQRGQGGWNQ